MIRLGVIAHPGYDGVADIIGTLVREGPRLGFQVSYEEHLEEFVPGAVPLAAPQDLDVLVSLGGDGTLLRAARYLNGAVAPVLGVNLGRLGFLTSCGAKDFPELLPKLATGSYETEVRMALEARPLGPGAGDLPTVRALNDIVLHKGGFARVLRLKVSVNGEDIGHLAADGIAVSTPTGSTAYSLSAGGPIVHPEVESILVTAISPHTLAVRPILLPPTAEIVVQPDAQHTEVLVTVDGQGGAILEMGHGLAVRRSANPVRVVRFPGTTFFGRLRHKLGWGGLAERDE